MSLHSPFLSVLKVNPPPLWFVTNGETTVGPVFTGRLMRGVDEGRIPEYCRVSADYGRSGSPPDGRRPQMPRWRQLESVREIAARKRSGVNATESAAPLEELMRPEERIWDEEELSHQVTHLAMLVTRAESGMLHLRTRSGRSLCTRAVLGPMPARRLGDALRETDLVVKSARVGRPVIGPPYGPTEDALAIRFAASAGGVGAAAMLPIFVGRSLLATLELSRPGHAFRGRDLQRVERIAQRALCHYAS